MDGLEAICRRLDCSELTTDLERALGRFGFCGQALRGGLERLSQWYDLDNAGVGKLLAIYLREFCAIFEEAGRIYVSVPSPVVLSVALRETGRIRVYTAELCVMIVLNGIFGLNMALPGSCCESRPRCALLENRKGILQRALLPRPDILLWLAMRGMPQNRRGDRTDAGRGRDLHGLHTKKWRKRIAALCGALAAGYSGSLRIGRRQGSGGRRGVEGHKDAGRDFSAEQHCLGGGRGLPHGAADAALPKGSGRLLRGPVAKLYPQPLHSGQYKADRRRGECPSLRWISDGDVWI